MAKVHLDRLRKKYKGVEVRGNLYSEIVEQIIDQNVQNVQKKMITITNRRMNEVANKISTKERRLVLPEMEDVFPKRAPHVRKVAEKGKIISETLRGHLTKALRESLEEFSGTGEESMVPKRGVTTGRINPKLVQNFQGKITEVFENYTKSHPRFKMPTNVHDIAVTEVRSTVNNLKHEYTKSLIDRNADKFIVRKKWKHNPHLSQIPRKGHNIVNKKTVDFDDVFMVPLYEKVKGKLTQTSVNAMRYPHDPNAPKSQVIGCNCDYDIIIFRKPKGR